MSEERKNIQNEAGAIADGGGSGANSGKNVSHETFVSPARGLHPDVSDSEQLSGLSDNALREQADANADGKATVRELYRYFRGNGLGRIDSRYNALVLVAMEKIGENRKIKARYKNLFAHPKGWFRRNKDAILVKSAWNVLLGLLLLLPILLFALSRLPVKLGKWLRGVSERADSSVHRGRRLGRFLRKHGAIILALVFAGVVAWRIGAVSRENAEIRLYINGESLGYIRSADVYYQALAGAESDLSDLLGIQYRISEQTASYSLEEVPKPVYLSETDVRRALTEHEKATNLANGYGLYIDDTLVAVSESRMIMDQILQETLKLYSELYATSRKTDAVLSFSNSVRISEITVPKTMVRSENEIRQILGLDALTHLSDLLLIDDTLESPPTPKEVSAMLPELSTISAETVASYLPEENQYYVAEVNDGQAGAAADGDVVPENDENGPEEEDAPPVLTFKTTEIETVTEIQPCNVEFVYDDSLLEGRKIVSVPGVDGIKISTYEVSFVDGEEIGRELLAEEILKEPQTKIIKIGTKPREEYSEETAPTGTFIMPYNGLITSTFSGRTLFGTYEFHGALDICGPYGSPVVATDGGEVVFAGSGGSYGNYVIIDHGDGIESLYAHLSSFNVAVGDKVGQGWKIGEIGKTGRATGYHVHFEIRVDGVRQDPQSYLNQ